MLVSNQMLPYPCIVISAAASALSGSRGGLRCALVTDGGWGPHAGQCCAGRSVGPAQPKCSAGVGAGAIQTGEEMQCPGGRAIKCWNSLSGELVALALLEACKMRSVTVLQDVL